MITMSQYRRACYLVDRYGADEAFATFLYPNAQGRRSIFTPRTFLIGCLLTIEVRRTMLYKDIYEVLTRLLPPEAMLELGVAIKTRRDDRPVAKIVLKSNHVYAVTQHVRKRCGGGKHGHRIEPDDKAALLDVVNRVLRATHPTRPEGSGTYAVDESGVWAWSRGRKRNKLPTEDRDGEKYNEVDDVIEDDIRRSVDRDANWGGKTAKNGSSEMYFGYSLHGIIRAPAPGAGYDSEPIILQRLDLTPASTDIVDATLAMIDQIRTEGVAVDELIGDRHYSFKKADRWVHQLLKRGIKQVVDLVASQQGFTDAAGTRVAAGVPHCPATPDHLGVIARPGPAPKTPKTLTTTETADQDQKQREAHRKFSELIAERMHFALQRHARSAANPNNYRWQCPAVAGKVGCPLRSGTVEVAAAAGLPVIESPPAPADAPKVCTSKGGTVTLKLDDLQPKVHQEDYWGSPEWTKSYARRTYVEGYFGTLKDAAVANLVRGAFRGDCLGLKLLHVGLCCALTNFRLVRKWHNNTGNRLDLPDVLLAPDDHPTEFVLDDEESSEAA